MPSVTIKYAIRPSRSQHRQGNNMITTLAMVPPTNLRPSDAYQLPWAPSTINLVYDRQDHNNDYSAVFSFWSIAAGRDSFVTTENMPTRRVNVGNGDIIATAWYVGVYPNRVGTSEPGIQIDAFNVTYGVFIDDDFLRVDPRELTARANNEGFVSTSMSRVMSIEPLDPLGSASFQKWEFLLQRLQINPDASLTADRNSSGNVLALYKSPEQEPIRRPIIDRIPDVILDIIGDPALYNPAFQQLAAVFELADTASKVNENLRSSVFELATKQVYLLSDEIINGMKTSIDLMGKSEEPPKEPPKPPKLPSDVLVKSAVKEKSLAATPVSRK